MIQSTKQPDPVLGVLVNPQTYRNLLYLLLSFPLGVFYFVFLVMGFSLGIGLAIIWVGVPILIAVLILSRVFANLERQLTSQLLNIPIAVPKRITQGNYWQRAKALISNPVTYTEMFYLFSKFILGILSFTLVVSLLATSLGLIVTPFFWNQWNWDIGIPGIWEVDGFSKAAATSVVGAILGIASLHFLNGLAWVYGEYTKGILETEKTSI
jgi:hypothetical protein